MLLFSVVGLFTHSVTGDRLSGEDYLTEPELSAFWIPSPNSLMISVAELVKYHKEIPPPPVVVKVHDKMYLVTLHKGYLDDTLMHHHVTSGMSRKK